MYTFQKNVIWCRHLGMLGLPKEGHPEQTTPSRLYNDEGYTIHYNNTYIVYLYIFQLLVVGDRAFPVLHKISAYTGEFTKRDQVSAVCYTICSLSVYLSANRQLRLHPFRECPCASISIFMVVIVNVFNWFFRGTYKYYKVVNIKFIKINVLYCKNPNLLFFVESLVNG